MNLLGEAGAPGKLETVLAGFPDVLQAAHAVAGAVGGVHHCAVDGGVLKGIVNRARGCEIKLVVAVGAFGGELGLGRAIDGRGLGAFNHAEAVALIGGADLLVACRRFIEDDIGMRAGGGQGVLALNRGPLRPVDHARCALGHLHRERDTRDLGAVLGVVGAARKGALGLVLRRGSEHIDCGVVLRSLVGVELAVRDVHQNIVARLGSNLHQGTYSCLQVRGLLRCGRFGKVLVVQQTLRLGKLVLDGRSRPRLCGVLVFAEGGRIVVKVLQLLLGFRAHRLGSLRDVVRGCLELVAIVFVPKGVNGKGPIAGTVRVLGQLATRRLGKPQLNAHALVHPIVGSELGAIGGQSIRAGGVGSIVSPGYGLHVRPKVTVAAVDVNAQELAE